MLTQLSPPAADRYGWLDLILCQILGMRRDGRGVFCSEACAAALDLPDPTKYGPGELATFCDYVAKHTHFILRT